MIFGQLFPLDNSFYLLKLHFLFSQICKLVNSPKLQINMKPLLAAYYAKATSKMWFNTLNDLNNLKKKMTGIITSFNVIMRVGCERIYFLLLLLMLSDVTPWNRNFTHNLKHKTTIRVLWQSTATLLEVKWSGVIADRNDTFCKLPSKLYWLPKYAK